MHLWAPRPGEVLHQALHLEDDIALRLIHRPRFPVLRDHSRGGLGEVTSGGVGRVERAQLGRDGRAGFR